MMFFDIFPIVGLLVFIVLLLAKAVVLKRNGITMHSKKPQSNAIRFLLYPLFVLIGVLILAEIIAPFSKSCLSLLPVFLAQELLSPIFWKLLGTSIILASLVLFFVTLQHFSNSLRIGFDENNLGQLITSGVFSLSRNPMFLSVELYFIGVALVIGNIFFLSIAFFTVLAIHFFILKEEKFMIEHYGDEYRNYSKKTARYFRTH